MSELAPQPGLRAFDIFDNVPRDHRLHLVTDTRLEPHILLGEFAVVDLTDRNVAWGEVYLVDQTKGPMIWQVRQLPAIWKSVENPGAIQAYLAPLNLPKVMADGEVDFSRPFHICDGPLGLDYLNTRIMGRVVGIFQAPR